MRQLSPENMTVLTALDANTNPDAEPCVSFALLTLETGFSRQEVRRRVRFLARLGLSEYHKGLWHDDGTVGGAGYCITKEGRNRARNV